MNFKRIICFIIAIVMVSSLCACAGASVPSGVDEEGVFVYTVVRSKSKDVVEAEDGAKLIRATIKANFDCRVSIIYDNAYEDFDGNYEILVGNTDRKESAEAKQRLYDNCINNAADFIVAVIGDKICIQAISDDMFPIATEWFLTTFCGSLEDWAKLKKGYEFIYHPDGTEINSTVSGKNISFFTFVLPRKSSMLHAIAVDEIIEHYNNSDYTVKLGEDFDAEDEYEVLVGDCDREASKSVEVEGDNYVIKVIGKKLVIKGGTHLATWRGVKAFYDEIVKSQESGTPFSWTDGYTYNGKYDATEKGVYTLNWNDEFESSTIDYNKWSEYSNFQSTTPPSSLGGTMYHVNPYGESKYTGSEKKNLIYQSDGYMVCCARRVNDKDFITSDISTYYTMTYKYGIMDIYGKIAQDPAYTTYWLNASDASKKEFVDRFGAAAPRTAHTEIDIFENYSRPYEYGSTVHWWWTNYNSDGSVDNSAYGHAGLAGKALYKKGSKNSSYYIYDQEKYGDLLPDDFHMYSFYWDDKSFKFACDGKIYMRYYFTNENSTSLHTLMNYFVSSCAVGDASYGWDFEKGVSPEYYEHKIDYIRLYQTDAINSQLIKGWNQKVSNGTSTVVYPDHPVAGY